MSLCAVPEGCTPLAVALGILLTAGPVVRAENLALAERGSRAFSNGDAIDGEVRRSAGKAIDGDASLGSGFWASSLNDQISRADPAIWGVAFPQPEKVNKVVIQSYPSPYVQLTDFQVEYETEAGEFLPVEPLDRDWSNPVSGETRNRATYLFRPVDTTRLRIVITGSGGCHVPLPWGRQKADAYLVEFEAYNADLRAERDLLRQRRRLVAGLRRKSARRRAALPDNAAAGESPNARWLSEERLRAGYAIGIDHLAKYAADLRDAGVNTIINHYWRGVAPEDDPVHPESAIASTDATLAPLGMRQFIWTSLYFYPEDLPHPLDAPTRYRRTVDAFGVESIHGPCPLDERMWVRFERIATRVAKLAVRYPTVQGFQFDWELYAADSGTSGGSFAYNTQQCYCDHCFGLFLDRVGVTAVAEDLPSEERFPALYEAGLLDKYFAVLSEDVYARGLRLRRGLHAANPDLILGWYGTNSTMPYVELPERSRIFAQQSGYEPSTWFGHALARALGTPRLPMVFMPNTIWDVRPGSDHEWSERGECWWSGERSLAEQARIDAVPGLHVRWVDGIIPLSSLGADGLERAVRWAVTEGNGYWLNELYRLTAPREDAAWMDGEYAETVEDYWSALRAGHIR